MRAGAHHAAGSDPANGGKATHHLSLPGPGLCRESAALHCTGGPSLWVSNHDASEL